MTLIFCVGQREIERRYIENRVSRVEAVFQGRAGGDASAVGVDFGLCI